MTRVHAPELYPRKRPKIYTAQRDQFLRENVGIDPAILAVTLGFTERYIISYQRKLGLRPFTSGRSPGATL